MEKIIFFLYFHVFANRCKKGVKCLRAVLAVFARYCGKEGKISLMMSLGPTPESDAKKNRKLIEAVNEPRRVALSRYGRMLNFFLL